MRRSQSKWVGLLFTILGIWLIMKLFGVAFSIVKFLLRGGWTLFLIVPGILEVARGTNKKSGIKKIIIGVVLFLFFQARLPFRTLILFVAAAVFLYFGIEILFRDEKRAGKTRTFYNTPDSDRYFGDAYEGSGYTGGRKWGKSTKYGQYNGTDVLTYTALFSDKTVKVENERFSGAELSCIFGDLHLDLRNSFIIDDVEIAAKCIFGNLVILLPEDVRMVVEGNAVFGDICKEHRNPVWADENTPAVFIKLSCVFGDIKVK